MWWMVILLSSGTTSSAQEQCLQLIYMPEAGYEEKHATIFYDEQFMGLAEEISCFLESLQISYSNLVALYPANLTLRDVCRSGWLANDTSRLHLTVTVTEALEIEEICQNDVLLLHMKIVDNKWLGHIVTPRSDIIVPLETERGRDNVLVPELESLLMLMETVAMLWGPVYFTPDKSKYKSMKLIENALKTKLVILPTLVICMVFLVGMVGLMGFYAKRKKEAADRKMLQKRRSHLLAEWGNEQFQGSPIWNFEGEQNNETTSLIMSEGQQKTQPTPKPRLPKGSAEVAISETDKSKDTKE